MKKFITLFGLFSVLLTITSCETQEINDETGKEKQFIDKEEIGNPDDEDPDA